MLAIEHGFLCTTTFCVLKEHHAYILNSENFRRTSGLSKGGLVQLHETGGISCSSLEAFPSIPFFVSLTQEMHGNNGEPEMRIWWINQREHTWSEKPVYNRESHQNVWIQQRSFNVEIGPTIKFKWALHFVRCKSETHFTLVQHFFCLFCLARVSAV